MIYTLRKDLFKLLEGRFKLRCFLLEGLGIDIELVKFDETFLNKVVEVLEVAIFVVNEGLVLFLGC